MNATVTPAGPVIRNVDLAHTCTNLVALSYSCRGKALDRALAATWKVLQDESTGLPANIEQKVRLLVTYICRDLHIEYLLFPHEDMPCITSEETPLQIIALKLTSLLCRCMKHYVQCTRSAKNKSHQPTAACMWAPQAEQSEEAHKNS
jgi:hypothetical protein